MMFLAALFFTPILTAIPKCAYGPALIIVGILMIDSVNKIDFDDMTELIPAFVTITFMAFTYNLGIGITSGLVVYPLIKLLSGRASEVKAGAWVLGGISLIFYIFYPYQ
jgi:AGZA family xanthine/uracil permease-like MFS transporter